MSLPPPSPHQPLVRRSRQWCFRPNAQVQALVEHHPQELEALLQGPFSEEDKAQLVELLGWPLDQVHARGWALDVVAPPRAHRLCPPHPIQPLWMTPTGTLRFKANTLVDHVLETGALDLNTLAIRHDPHADRQQLAQLIGYSFSGACELSYMTGAVLDAAEREWTTRQARERQARLEQVLPPSPPPRPAGPTRL